MAYEDVGCSFMDGVSRVDKEVGYVVTKVIVHTCAISKGGIHGVSP
jgi:hypothetical protein